MSEAPQEGAQRLGLTKDSVLQRIAEIEAGRSHEARAKFARASNLEIHAMQAELVRWEQTRERFYDSAAVVLLLYAGIQAISVGDFRTLLAFMVLLVSVRIYLAITRRPVGAGFLKLVKLDRTWRHNKIMHLQQKGGPLSRSYFDEVAKYRHFVRLDALVLDQLEQWDQEDKAQALGARP